MPNQIDNRLTVLGPLETVNRFATAARGRHPRTGDKAGSPNALTASEPVSPICFHALVPLPPDYCRKPYAIEGYGAEMDAWGVKWGAFEWNEPVRVPGCATFTFRTAWRAPTKFLSVVAKQWPQLRFNLSWQEWHGPECGTLVWTTGRVIAADCMSVAAGGWSIDPISGGNDSSVCNATAHENAEGSESWSSNSSGFLSGRFRGEVSYEFRRPVLPVMRLAERARCGSSTGYAPGSASRRFGESAGTGVARANRIVTARIGRLFDE